jgi:hypothetical protein
MYPHSTEFNLLINITHDLVIRVGIPPHIFWKRCGHPTVFFASMMRIWDPVSAGADENTGLVFG